LSSSTALIEFIKPDLSFNTIHNTYLHPLRKLPLGIQCFFNHHAKRYSVAFV